MITRARRIARPSRSRGVRLLVALQPGGALGDQHFGAEFLRLGVGAAGERLAGDARRKAEVVLDLRARAGLSARRLRLEDQHVEPFRRAVDRGGETRGPAPTTRQVADLRRVDGVVEARGSRRSLVRRVTQDRLAAADQDRHVGDGTSKRSSKLLHVRFAIEVDVACTDGRCA